MRKHEKYLVIGQQQSYFWSKLVPFFLSTLGFWWVFPMFCTKTHLSCPGALGTSLESLILAPVLRRLQLDHLVQGEAYPPFIKKKHLNIPKWY